MSIKNVAEHHEFVAHTLFSVPEKILIIRAARSWRGPRSCWDAILKINFNRSGAFLGLAGCPFAR
jgi:hypothetical protein